MKSIRVIDIVGEVSEKYGLTPYLSDGLMAILRGILIGNPKNARHSNRKTVINKAVTRLKKQHPEVIVEAVEKVMRAMDVTLDDIIQGLLIEAEGRGPDTNSRSRITAWMEIAKLKGILEEKKDENLKIEFAENWNEPVKSLLEE